ITDAIIDPEGEEGLNVEQPLRLADCMYCYRPAAAPDPLPTEPASPAPVFGSFNNLQKLSARTVPLWAAVLCASAGAPLLVKSGVLADVAVRERVTAGFAAEGTGAERLLLKPWIESTEGHLAAYREIDVALDTYPYNGATTTCEALWMGVPVV